MTTIPLNIRPFGSGSLPVQAIVVRSLTDGEWGTDGVLIRTEDGTVNHPDWPSTDPGVRPSHWAHLADIVRNGGGDDVTWDVAGFETSDDDASVVAVAKACFDSTTEGVSEDSRLFAGVVVPGVGPGRSPFVLPLHVLRDDAHTHVLVLDSARIDRYRVTVSHGGSARWSTFRSTTYPHLHGRPSWQVDGGIALGLTYGVDSIEVDVRDRPRAETERQR
jgi:hypothetical protein